MNALTALCAEISKAGYSGNPRIEARLHDDSILAIGKFLLNNSGLEKTVLPRWQLSDGQDVALGFGGGIDSYCALLQALSSYKRVFVVFVDYGHSSCAGELRVFNAIHDAVKYASNDTLPPDHDPFIAPFWKDLRTVALRNNPAIWFNHNHIPLIPMANTDHKLDLGWKDYIVPARNLVLAANCAEYSSNVWIVANKRNDETVGTPDKSSFFYASCSAAFSEHYGRDVTVKSPFFTKSKLEVVKATLEVTRNIQALKNTFSCYTPEVGYHPCGTCYACYKRYKLFQALNEEFNFKVHPVSGSHFHEYEEAERKKRG